MLIIRGRAPLTVISAKLPWLQEVCEIENQALWCFAARSRHRLRFFPEENLKPLVPRVVLNLSNLCIILKILGYSFC